MNILLPEYPEYVTVDRHAYRIAIGDKGRHGAVAIGIKRYREISIAYKKASEQTMLTVVELQAVVWCKYKNELIKETPF